MRQPYLGGKRVQQRGFKGVGYDLNPTLIFLDEKGSLDIKLQVTEIQKRLLAISKIISSSRHINNIDFGGAWKMN